MEKLVILICICLLAIVIGLAKYLSCRRKTCLEKLDMAEKIIEAYEEFDWVALVAYDLIDDASQLAFDRYTHMRVHEVAGVFKKKFPTICAAWETEHPEYFKLLSKL